MNSREAFEMKMAKYGYDMGRLPDGGYVHGYVAFAYTFWAAGVDYARDECAQAVVRVGTDVTSAQVTDYIAKYVKREF